MIILKFLPVEGWLKFVLYMVPYLVVGYDILRKAFKGILNKQVFDENFLMAVATIGAIALGNYKEGVSVMLFYQIGELFQSYAVGKSRRNISDLMDIRPDYANIEKDGELEQVDPDEVEVGTIIVVQPGEKVPIDGVIEEGSSTLNTSALTGESVPREAAAGDEVISGCINLTGLLKIRTTKEFGESTVSKILDLVENSSSKKSRSENFISKFARYYTPAVCYGALALAILPPLVRMFAFALAPEWGDWIYRALTFLVISCPCALGLATPTAIMVGIGKGAERGILIKDAESLETAKSIGTVVLDKTGTLTEGKPIVTDLLWTGDEQRLGRVFYSMESRSEHPLAEALAERLKGEGIPISDFENLPGRGVKGVAAGRTYLAGNRLLLEENGIAAPSHLLREADRLAAAAKTVVWFAEGGEAVGIAAIADRIRPGAAQAVAELRAMGLDVRLLTGDNEATARAIAAEAGITACEAGVLPDGKAAYIRRLQAEGHRVAMVGDGINDSAALAQADLSIAMGQGSDIAMDVAKITIMTPDLGKIADAIRLSAATVRTIRQNLFWAFIYNLIGVPVAAGVLFPLNGFLLNPMLAGAAMALSSVSVVANSLRLKAKGGRARKNDGREPIPINNMEKTMEKKYRIEGMMCGHCRMHVEKALNGIDGVRATVELEPPVATVEFSGGEKPLAELQRALDGAGEYKITEV